ncbi:predicted protein [Naegleria gruberi]|uniref:Predicted protein n=1 Tax=Naegleria gruberi TaxID=5762 RepID=D2VFR2_NAEGR|nr:uncharacterized protein NAEGRDRAFT_79800 [Naegleria gruberi]EFC44516.1 predicted protein [Naegleria gruberi]|eukprot:XP_002677260.1 predicted protein [Naegleria gruberi strain NEG-M]
MSSSALPPPPPDCFHGLSYSFPKMTPVMNVVAPPLSLQPNLQPSLVNIKSSSTLNPILTPTIPNPLTINPHPLLPVPTANSVLIQTTSQHHHEEKASAAITHAHQSVNGNVKQCANFKCGTTKTPLWRKGWCIEEASPKNNFKAKTVFLCNKCGLHYRKGHYCKECLEIFKESDMRNEKQFWLICTNCNQWIHKKCMKNPHNESGSYTCCECQENPNRTVNNKRKKTKKSKQSSDEEEEEIVTSPSTTESTPKRRVVEHFPSEKIPVISSNATPQSPTTSIPSPNQSTNSPSMPFKKRLKNQPPSPINMQNLSPKVAGSMARIYSKIDGYTTETSSPTTSETEDVDYSLAFSPMTGQQPGVFYFHQPIESKSAIDVLASICEQLQ